MRNVRDKSVEKSHILYSYIYIFILQSIIFTNIVQLMIQCGTIRTAEYATYDNIIRRMHFACRITKAANIGSEYLILIAFPLQQ